MSSADKQRLEELVAVLSMYGAALTEVVPEQLLQAAHAVCEGDADAGDAAAAAHAGCSYSGVLQFQSQHCSTHAAGLSASLVFSMPPGYPQAAALHVHVTSSHLPRSTVDALTQQLQQQATASQGCECLHELADKLQQELHVLQEQQEQDVLQQQQRQAQEQLLQQHAAAGQGFRWVLLRLDHMRDRAGYTNIIKQWAAELHLTGYVLFWQSLILILLEGTNSNISTYLRQARTQCVDVDSNGRKCRERMLTIVEVSTHVSGDGHDSSKTSASCVSCLGSPVHSHHKFADFRELNLQTLEEVVHQLSVTHPLLDADAVKKLIGIS